MPNTAQFQALFQAWHSLQPRAADPAAAMAAFFDAWHRLPARRAPRPSLLEARRLAEFAAAFPAAHARHARSGVHANAWRSAGVGQDEMRNSGALRWLLDGLGDHGQAPAIVEEAEKRIFGAIDDFPGLAANGFRVEGGLLFHPIRLDAAALADAYPDSLDDALEPVDEALAHLAAALPELNRLIEAAQSHFTPQYADAPEPG